MEGTLVLVTGATGFIAGHCVEELLTHGYAVRGTVRDRRTADVAHLEAIAARTGGSLEFVQADLDRDAGWSEAVEGCAYVWHIASPFPADVPRHEDDVIRPAVEGTLRVLHAAAASGSVRRVVLTSSIAAIAVGHDERRVLTESDWSILDGGQPYQKSKTLAERAAWDFARESGLELVTINPGQVLGPVQRPQRPTSLEMIRRILGHEMPALPDIRLSTVDVRDVANAHLLATETPHAAGNRYICSGDNVSVLDVASTLAEEYRPRGYQIPTRVMPYWLLWLIGRFDSTARLALTFVGRRQVVTARKATEELGWTMRPVRESVIDTAESLLRHGVVRRSHRSHSPSRPHEAFPR
jgi:dihydroflavonol-4-reductase